MEIIRKVCAENETFTPLGKQYAWATDDTLKNSIVKHIPAIGVPVQATNELFGGDPLVGTPKNVYEFIETASNKTPAQNQSQTLTIIIFAAIALILIFRL